MGLYDPGAGMSMANTAEELGRRYEITREECDEFGYRSHNNAKQARDEGWFDVEIEPVAVAARRSLRAGRRQARHAHHGQRRSLKKMARLRAAFEPGGVITAGNASAVVDGAAAMVICKESDAAKARSRAAGASALDRHGVVRSADHGLGAGARGEEGVCSGPGSRARRSTTSS